VCVCVCVCVCARVHQSNINKTCAWLEYEQDEPKVLKSSRSPKQKKKDRIVLLTSIYFTGRITWVLASNIHKKKKDNTSVGEIETHCLRNESSRDSVSDASLWSSFWYCICILEHWLARPYKCLSSCGGAGGARDDGVVVAILWRMRSSSCRNSKSCSHSLSLSLFVRLPLLTRSEVPENVFSVLVCDACRCLSVCCGVCCVSLLQSMLRCGVCCLSVVEYVACRCLSRSSLASLGVSCCWRGCNMKFVHVRVCVCVCVCALTHALDEYLCISLL